MGKLLYKYRSLEPWDYLLDIFINKRLFASSFEHLNDPMEGMFTYSKSQVSPLFIRQIVEQKSLLRICSLSRTRRSTLMWSYYASGHAGLVIGLEVVLDNTDQYEVRQVSYQQRISFKGYSESNAVTDAKNILSKKFSGWKHEQEVRVLTLKKFVPVTVRNVILGYRMPKDKQDLLKTLLHRIDPNIQIEKLEKDELDSQFTLKETTKDNY